MLVRVVHAILKRYGPKKLKQAVWDREYADGKWDTGDTVSARRDLVCEVVDRFLKGGELLDLGCGAGSTSWEIDQKYRFYWGVDVSELAIKSGQARVLESPELRSKVRFSVDDIQTFVPDQKFTVILFRESIYYIPLANIRGVLLRYSDHLEAGGVFVVRLDDQFKHKGIVQLIEANFLVVERFSRHRGGALVLVFRPREQWVESGFGCP